MSEGLIGLSTLDCARMVVARNPEIDTIFIRAYTYIPGVISGNGDRRIPVERSYFLNGINIDDFLDSLDDSYNLALDSWFLRSNSETGQFLMMDLFPRKSAENQQKIERRLNDLIVPKYGGGFLLETKRSYHFMGFNITDQTGWIDFLGRCLLTSIVTKPPEDRPFDHEFIADYRYIGHAMVRGSTGLRVTSRGKKTFLPVSINIIGENFSLEDIRTPLALKL